LVQSELFSRFHHTVTGEQTMSYTSFSLRRCASGRNRRPRTLRRSPRFQRWPHSWRCLLNVNGLALWNHGCCRNPESLAPSFFESNCDGMGYKTLYSFGSSSASDGSIPVGWCSSMAPSMEQPRAAITHYGSVYSFDPSTQIERSSIVLTAVPVASTTN